MKGALKIVNGKAKLVSDVFCDGLGACLGFCHQGAITIKSITYAHMKVPCCTGLISVIKDAIAASGKNIPFKDITIGINGKQL